MLKPKLAWIAALVAVVITTVMDFTGYTIFSALPLIGITLMFWLIQKHSLSEFGLKFGSLKHYGYALSYPAFVIGLVTLFAFLAGEASFETIEWNRTLKNIGLQSTIGVIGVLLTEEGFFRGWLWASLKRDLSIKRTLLITSVLFTVWHISAVTSGTEYGLPGYQVPIYLTNAVLLGLVWGLLRQISGSVIVASVSHAVWNAFAYELFAYGEITGALGVKNTIVFGPEIGLLGIVFNGLFAWWLWRKVDVTSQLN